MKKTLAILTVLCFVAAVVPAVEKAPVRKKTSAEIEGMIAKGLAAYKAGKNQEAIEALQQAVAAIQKTQQQGLVAFLPEAPAGWEAGKIDSGSVGAITGEDGQTYSAINLSRKYTRKGEADDDKQTQVTVTVHSQKEMIEAAKGMAEAYKNPQFITMMESAGKIKFTAIDQNGWSGWKIVSAEGNDATATAFCGDLMLTVQVNKPDGKTLDLFWKAIDLKGLAGAATTKIEK
jgi:hypothetical protein